jgi:hypothetical protein
MFAQQFGMSAEIRPRYENKHGYKNLLATGADGSNFISQRTRLNFDFKNEKLKLKLSMQNVRVWGDVSTLSANDNANALHQAWAEIVLNSKLSLKLGRQEIVYDDSRIFGNVGWAQQARSHDAFIFKYFPNQNNRLDVGFALNSDSQSEVDNLYSNVAGYKTFQYAWYHGKFNQLGISFLLLNTGIEYLDGSANQKIDYFQTIGPRFTYKKDKFNANAALYFQSGKIIDTKVNAIYYSANIGYKLNDKLKVAIGYEYLSGKDMDDSDADIKTFSPLFGTNHKFNGWMDYFYVGYGNPTGLQDIYATIAYNKEKFSAKLVPHLFSAAANVYNGTDKMNAGLGTEIDLAFGYKIAKDIKLSAGYSVMMATETMEVIKSGDKDENNSWAWIMFTFKPNLFKHTIK